MCRAIVKYTLFVVNLVFTLIGLALIGVGVAAIFLLDDYFVSLVDNIQLDVKFLPYVVIALGALIFLIAFSGCCGSVTECQCLLVTYAVIMLLLAAAKIYLAVVVFRQIADIKDFVVTALNDTFDNPHLNNTFHAMEYLLKCCGKTGPDDYDMVYDGVAYAPPTCCNLDTSPFQDWTNTNNTSMLIQQYVQNATGMDGTETPGLCLKEDAFVFGCSTLIGDMIEKWALVTGYVLIGMIVFEVMGMIFASVIACTIRKKY